MIAAFVGGQLFMLSHVAEHQAMAGGDTIHICHLCLSGSSLDTPVPGVAAVDWQPPTTTYEIPSVGERALLSTARISVLARGPPQT